MPAHSAPSSRHHLRCAAAILRLITAQVFEEIEGGSGNPCNRFHVQQVLSVPSTRHPVTHASQIAWYHAAQVLGHGDCLFHSIAIAMAFEDERCHLDMFDESLPTRVRKLRDLAVETLTADPNRTLYLEGNQTIVINELVCAAAEQYDMTAEAYCTSMRRDGVWGGGPEILALANALQRPIHVFEPVAACNGTEFRLQLCGAFGSPGFDECGKRVCIIAADDRFPDCKPVEVRRHGEGGNHFLALLPASALDA